LLSKGAAFAAFAGLPLVTIMKRDKTTLILTQTGFVNEQAHQHSLTAWTQVLKTIKELIEKV